MRHIHLVYIEQGAVTFWHHRLRGYNIAIGYDGNKMAGKEELIRARK